MTISYEERKKSKITSERRRLRNRRKRDLIDLPSGKTIKRR